MQKTLKKIALSLALALPVLSVFAQNDAPLFTVGTTPVTVEEFKYIYTKNNGMKANFADNSVREYLDLYTKFKLKVNRAREMRLDTIPSLRDELEGYRRQLSNSYLMDRTIVESLTREAYRRSGEDIDISHIVAQMPANPTPADTLTAYRKVQGAMNRLKAGEAFEKVAKDGSEDASTRDNGGKIGWFTALQLPGYYALETAAYSTSIGSYSDIIRSPMGYHIIKVNNKRDAYGEVKAAHILVRIKKDAQQQMQDSAKLRIDQLYARLAKENFEDVARLESDDKLTAFKGGEVGWFSINKYEASFEEAAFGLKDNGAYSQPFQTAVGWHIIKRLDRRRSQVYEEVRTELTGKVKRDSRFEKAQEAFVVKVKAENGYKENTANVSAYAKSLSKEFLDYAWKADVKEADKDKEMFVIGNKTYKLIDLTTFLERAATARSRGGKDAEIDKVFQEQYNKYVQAKALEYEEGQLGKKYPEFRSLMREYEEGILLFEATKRMVWDKASEDSTGLKRFYDENKQKYLWGERVKTIKYNINSEDAKVIAKVHELAAKGDVKKVVDKMNKKGANIVSFEEAVVEKGKNPIVDALKWEKGARSADSKVGTVTSFTQVAELVKPMPKSLKEARGYAVADYQTFLETKWIEDLRKAYPIKIDDAILRSIIK
jgi:peptidyl-prolyl cis-trans isomerase SurA